MTYASDFTQNGVTFSWLELLRDEAALMRHPGARHRKLIDGAYELHRAQLIGPDDLADLLERADGALEYAVEALLDEPSED
ncbi:hypothetical protein SAMN04515675_1893 [Pseudomonas costantinii]|uniref:Uncharacterized protein n=1 Tax=Pseudomonas costantinii TaxID=168469 RepID=A0A1S2V6C5_9PSED|nr:hypothetical protein BFL40_06090 [Pseudomonas costantinii]SED65080.1 hypothetical protein SAMN04515675_1893 [Pseudomonas costantinii]